MFESLLVANRGEIAIRVMRTARRLGIRTIAVYSDADATAWHVAEADAALRIGLPPAGESYLDIDAILEAARVSGAAAIHPGYGFLSENAAFADACVDAGLIFVGPSASAMRAMGDKASAKALMETAGVPLVPGYHGDDQNPALLATQAAEIGFPVLIKASAGGGGRGMRVVDSAGAFGGALDSARREAAAAFGDDRVLIEKYLTHSRHIEMQVFADRAGNTIHLGERDCSLQRRHQKVVEEAPAPGLSGERRDELGAAGVAAAKAIDYVGAGTVEFIVDASAQGANGPFYFMEMNTRLQVEHPVTEAITGYDLVEWQLRVAAGEALPAAQDEVKIDGHAVEVRLYAEDPVRDFLPSAGRISTLELPAAEDGLRIDGGYRAGDTVATDYDAMLAKIIAHGADRRSALDILAQALTELVLVGPSTNQAFLDRVVREPDFVAGDVDTGFIDRHRDSLSGADATPRPEILGAAVRHVLRARAAVADAGPEKEDPYSPWRAVDGWRSIVTEPETLRFRTGRGELSAVANDLPEDRDGRFRCIDDDGDIVVLDGADQYRLTLVRPIAEAAAHEAVAGSLTAPMPGKIVKVHVAVGDRVSRGQTLMVLEAMKMEHAIAAPADGRVDAVAFGAGDQVGEGAELLHLDTEEG